MMNSSNQVQALRWDGRALQLLDQRLLPVQTQYVVCRCAGEVAEAIRDMVVRGAPAIGIAAAYGVALAARDRAQAAPAHWRTLIEEDRQQLGAARPTAVNLMWAIERMRRCLAGLSSDPFAALLAEADAILAEDIAANRQMGELGAALIDGRCQVLTHCNAGALATGGYGTALGVVRAGFRLGKIAHVYADETRPWMQGARLTAYELIQDRIPVTLLIEGAAATLMRQGRVQWVIVGADRVTAQGDVVNKIGTYSLAVLARHHGVKMMVVAPSSTIDMRLERGEDVPIEQRHADEVLVVAGQRVAAAGAQAWNPVFDMTPHTLVDALVTERGVVRAPDRAKMAELF